MATLNGWDTQYPRQLFHWLDRLTKQRICQSATGFATYDLDRVDCSVCLRRLKESWAGEHGMLKGIGEV